MDVTKQKIADSAFSEIHLLRSSYGASLKETQRVPLLSVLNMVPILKPGLSKSVALVCSTARGSPRVWGQPRDQQCGCAGKLVAG